jgi:gliding motility-associatede transport system auxiliary component
VNTELLKARQTRYVAYVMVYVLVVLTAVVIVNFLASRHNKSYDSTANKRYSLSEQTVKIVKGLKQAPTITYFDQPRAFPHAKDLLDEYANLSPKLHVEYVDPDKNPQATREAGVTNYGTAIVQIGANKEEAKGFTEEGITGAIIRTLKHTTRTVCFVAGSGEHQIDDSDRTGYSKFKDLLGKDNYVAKSVDLLQKAEVPGDCTVLVVGGPTHDYQQPEVEAIQKYVEGGGRALLMLDPPLKIGRSITADNDALTGLLQSWGVTAEKDLILDLNPIGQLLGVGPQVALVRNYDSHAIVEGMKGTATGFPLARSLDIKNGDKTSVQKLFDSSDTSLATSNLSSPSVNADDPKNKKGPLTLAAAATYNTGKDAQGRFVVVGSSSWAANSFISFNGNSDLALNAIDWLSSDEDLISIRPKEREDRRITMTQAQVNWVRITSQFLLPLLVIVMGVSVWWKRR